MFSCLGRTPGPLLWETEGREEIQDLHQGGVRVNFLGSGTCRIHALSCLLLQSDPSLQGLLLMPPLHLHGGPSTFACLGVSSSGPPSSFTLFKYPPFTESLLGAWTGAATREQAAVPRLAEFPAEQGQRQTDRQTDLQESRESHYTGLLVHTVRCRPC